MDELRQILGTDVEDSQRKRGRQSSDKSDKDAIKDLKDEVAPTDEIVYKDSSTFLKVRIPALADCTFLCPSFETPFLTVISRGHSRRIHTMTTVNTLLTQARGHRILSGM